MARNKPDPILLGLPSPSLRKISRMNDEELTEHIERLVGEATHIRNRMEALKAKDPVPAEHLDMLQKQLDRLSTLEQIGRDKLAGKTSPLLDQQPERPRTSHRPTRGFRHRGGSPRATKPGSPGATSSSGGSYSSFGNSQGYQRPDTTKRPPRIDGPGGYE